MTIGITVEFRRFQQWIINPVHLQCTLQIVSTKSINGDSLTSKIQNNDVSLKFYFISFIDILRQFKTKTKNWFFTH